MIRRKASARLCRVLGRVISYHAPVVCINISPNELKDLYNHDCKRSKRGLTVTVDA